MWETLGLNVSNWIYWSRITLINSPGSYDHVALITCQNIWDISLLLICSSLLSLPIQQPGNKIHKTHLLHYLKCLFYWCRLGCLFICDRCDSCSHGREKEAGHYICRQTIPHPLLQFFQPLSAAGEETTWNYNTQMAFRWCPFQNVIDAVINWFSIHTTELSHEVTLCFHCRLEQWNHSDGKNDQNKEIPGMARTQ